MLYEFSISEPAPSNPNAQNTSIKRESASICTVDSNVTFVFEASGNEALVFKPQEKLLVIYRYCTIQTADWNKHCARNAFRRTQRRQQRPGRPSG